ncbi:MAG: hypothetical protein QF890_07425 [Myxococcota bacterium]|nr:hypothetical protein [bacterium]MDP7076477.1 hypothetical protein [Myxococcota bacterium]MDP7298775.1 hypothetical protein [Myxococcota bacterium]MDP7432387.1 hypothetical protein [Myxococcota bacterium]HJO23734.1 hypothetical protein [Myxococcota bacterium]
MKRPIVWLLLVFALVGAIYVLGVRKSYCESAAEDYCHRLEKVNDEAFQQCLAKATHDCEVHAAGG